MRVKGGGRGGKKAILQAASPSHMLLLYKGCLESQCTAQIQMLQTHTRTYAHTPPKEQLQKRELPFEREKKKKKAHNSSLDSQAKTPF